MVDPSDEVLKEDFLRHYVMWLRNPHRSPINQPGELDYPDLTPEEIDELIAKAESMADE